MKVGFVGLGKLGLPVAVAAALKGYSVMGYDLDPTRMSKNPQPYLEAGPDGTGDFNTYLAKADNLTFGTLSEVVQHSDIIFVAVQTPHEPRFEGTTPLPEDRADFNYDALCAAVAAVSQAAAGLPPRVLAIISTVLPGTMRRYVEKYIADNLMLVYNPSFIAMGSTMRDYLHPELVLLGSNNARAASFVDRYYSKITNAPAMVMSVESAELTKVAYNTYLSAKVAIANLLMEVCHKTPGANVDHVSNALQMSTRRILGPQYMRGGMGDGGGCHPRDNIAMSWLADKLALSHDLFGELMRAREANTRWLAGIVSDTQRATGYPVWLYGLAYKPGTGITTGSPARLLQHMLVHDYRHDVRVYDPYVDGCTQQPTGPAVIVITTKHPDFIAAKFPAASVVVDPHRYISPQSGVRVVPIGVGP